MSAQKDKSCCLGFSAAMSSLELFIMRSSSLTYTSQSAVLFVLVSFFRCATTSRQRFIYPCTFVGSWSFFTSFLTA